VVRSTNVLSFPRRGRTRTSTTLEQLDTFRALSLKSLLQILRPAGCHRPAESRGPEDTTVKGNCVAGGTLGANQPVFVAPTIKWDLPGGDGFETFYNGMFVKFTSGTLATAGVGGANLKRRVTSYNKVTQVATLAGGRLPALADGASFEINMETPANAAVADPTLGYTPFETYINKEVAFQIDAYDHNVQDVITITTDAEGTLSAAAKQANANAPTHGDAEATIYRSNYAWTPSAKFGGYNKKVCFTATDLGGNDDRVEDKSVRCITISVQRCYYYVGDDAESFSSIGTKFGLDYLTLWSFNPQYWTFNIAQTHKLSIGRLYEVARGDTLLSIAGNMGTTLASLKDFNFDVKTEAAQKSLRGGSAWSDSAGGSLSKKRQQLCVVPNTRSCKDGSTGCTYV